MFCLHLKNSAGHFGQGTLTFQIGPEFSATMEAVERLQLEHPSHLSSGKVFPSKKDSKTWQNNPSSIGFNPKKV